VDGFGQKRSTLARVGKATTWRLLTAALAALTVGPACSGDGGGSGVFDDPSDFDRSGCDSATPLDSIEPAGVWHANVLSPGGGGVATFRIEGDAAGGELAGLIYGADADDVRLTPDDLFIRRELEFDGVRQVIAIDLCQVEDDGLSGNIASCYGGDCSVAGIAAYPVPPLDEPEAEAMTLLSEWRGPPESPWQECATAAPWRISSACPTGCTSSISPIPSSRPTSATCRPGTRGTRRTTT
jgi:hypothetical protein